ncbi:MFS transporter [Neobittarella massiliensis]|uniref:MFS transporter n=1 Tax=Neobittarella massiliensis (ex Bilen et al. 2018) TaxID=2041842 RepID=A0A8J6IMU8_9FIRM|nr:MFS transporter [Neobittarella massiliensis]MBC3515422.1 MFS transporter [Neobittarella massiliensis]
MNNKKVWLFWGIVLIACNLRAPITSVGSLVSMIQGDTGMSSALAGFITTLPLLAFAVVSPFVSTMMDKLGMEWTMLLGLLSMIAGVLTRSFCGVPGIFIGTTLLGVGIAVGNILLPSIIKERFPLKVGFMTSLFTTSMSTFSAIGSGISVPAAEAGLGWRGSLAMWLATLALAALVWSRQLGRGEEGGPRGREVKGRPSPARRVMSSPLSWRIALYMGCQSFLFYSLVSWLATILQSRGISAADAGFLVLVFQLSSIPASFIFPIWAAKKRDQRLVTFVDSALFTVGVAGVMFAGDNLFILIPSLICAGLGTAGSLALALIFMSYRCKSVQQTATLSGMAQSIGYLLAAVGPILIGALYDVIGSWMVPLGVLVGVLVLLTLFGVGAARDRYILDEE